MKLAMTLEEYRRQAGLPVDPGPAPALSIGRRSDPGQAPMINLRSKNIPVLDFQVEKSEKPKKNKYSAVRTQGRDGRWYDSAREARYANSLLAMVGAGEIFSYIPHVRIPIGTDESGKEVRYEVDFLVVNHEPKAPVWVDVKGKDTERSRAKRAALRRLGIDVRLA